MSLSNPTDIAAVNVWNAAAAQSIQYKGHTADGVTDSNKFYYQTYDLDDINGTRRWVYYDITDDKWKDYGSWTPNGISVNQNSAGGTTSSVVVAGNTIRFWHGSDVRVTFTHPSWLNSSNSGSGGGTSTEGSSYSATLEVNSNGWLVYTIPTSSSAGTYYLLKSSDGGVTWTQHGQSITHAGTFYTQDSFAFDSSLIWIIRSPTEDELDRWSASDPVQKKVFCNFW